MAEPSGVGLGWRPEIAADLLRRTERVDFVEVVAETCFVQAAARREACALAEIWPVVPHGVKLSLGSAEGIEVARARALGRLARELGASVISEHVAFVRSGSREIGHLTQLPLTRAALSVLQKNVDRARSALPDVPLLLENVAWNFEWPNGEMSEPDFYSEVVARTGCRLLLDLGNLYANCVNFGLDPLETARRFPLDRVGMIHLAGGVAEDGFYFDDHAHAVPGAVFELLLSVLERSGPIPILIERDAAFPPFVELERELDLARGGLARAPVSRRTDPERAADALVTSHEVEQLKAAQNEMARLLTDVDAPSDDDNARFGRTALTRSRSVLKRKRVDEALPLLPSLCRDRSRLEPLAHAVVDAAPRPPRMVAIADAWRIAERALERPELRNAASCDRLLLRSRFRVDSASGVVEQRSLPFVGKETLANGRRIWALKGPGTAARVRIVESRGA